MEQQNSQPGEWPNGPCGVDKVYVMDTQWNDETTSKQQRVIVMSETSWGKFGTQLEQFRRLAAQQDSRLKELLAEVAMARQSEADMLDKLNIHRDIRRKEARAQIEGDLIVPGDSRFNARK